jgi:hypothetical protein
MKAPKLNQLMESINKEFNAQIVESQNEINLTQLFVEFPKDSKDRPRQLELLILPDDDGICFLQYFVALPYTVNKKQISDLSRLMLRINSKLPLIGFGLLEEMQLSFFRCIVPCPSQPLVDDIYVHTSHVILYIIDNLGPIVESLGNGEMSYDNCMHELIKYEG